MEISDRISGLQTEDLHRLLPNTKQECQPLRECSKNICPTLCNEHVKPVPVGCSYFAVCDPIVRCLKILIINELTNQPFN
jgi:hypothetical protein